MRKLMKNKTSGITLIALVVTIIVLLILAGISIQMLTGDNGILLRAGEARDITEEKQIIEEAQLDILAQQTSKLSGDLTEAELEGILSPKYGTLSTEEKRTIDKKLTTKDGKYIIPVSKIYNGRLSILTIPTIADADEKDYYGQPIDYDVDLGKYTDGETDLDLDGKPQYDWKIFYNDGTNIYIIAEDFVPMNNCSNLTTSVTNRTDGGTTYPYSLYWYGNIDNNKTGSVDIFTSNPSKTSKLADKFLSYWKPQVTGDNDASEKSNAKMVATLMDTNLWNNFATSTKVSELTDKADEFAAIGGPTLEMWIKSWNGKYPDDKLYCDNANSYGYYVKAGNSPSNNDYYIEDSVMQSKTGYGETLYFPHPLVNNSYDTFTTSNNCYGYWLASSTAQDESNIMFVECDGYVAMQYYGNRYCGVRPVVCLPSDITATWNETDGVWNIIKK